MLSAKYAMCVAFHSFRSTSCEEVDCHQDDLLEIISTLDDQWLVVNLGILDSFILGIGEKHDDEEGRG